MSSEDPLLEAAGQKLKEAERSVEEALRLLNYRRSAESLALVGKYLGAVANEFGAGQRDAGLALTMIDRKAAGRLMGGSKSPKKLAALAQARAVRAEKRRVAAEALAIRQRVCGL